MATSLSRSTSRADLASAVRRVVEGQYAGGLLRRLPGAREKGAHARNGDLGRPTAEAVSPPPCVVHGGGADDLSSIRRITWRDRLGAPGASAGAGKTRRAPQPSDPLAADTNAPSGQLGMDSRSAIGAPRGV